MRGGTGKKGRAACFQLSGSRGFPEHPGTLAREAEHGLNGAEVVDLRTLSLFKRQKKAQMPAHVQDAIGRVAGGYRTD